MSGKKPIRKNDTEKRKKISRTKTKDQNQNEESREPESNGNVSIHTVKMTFPLKLFKEELLKSFSSQIGDTFGVTKEDVVLTATETEIFAELRFRVVAPQNQMDSVLPNYVQQGPYQQRTGELVSCDSPDKTTDSPKKELRNGINMTIMRSGSNSPRVKLPELNKDKVTKGESPTARETSLKRKKLLDNNETICLTSRDLTEPKMKEQERGSHTARPVSLYVDEKNRREHIKERYNPERVKRSTQMTTNEERPRRSTKESKAQVQNSSQTPTHIFNMSLTMPEAAEVPEVTSESAMESALESTPESSPDVPKVALSGTSQEVASDVLRETHLEDSLQALPVIVHKIDKTKKQNRISLPINFGKLRSSASKGFKGEEIKSPKNCDIKSPRATEGIKSPLILSPRLDDDKGALINPDSIEANWDNLPRKIQSKINQAELKEVEIKDHMDVLWEIVRWLHPDAFVPRKYPHNATMKTLIAMGEKVLHQQDVPFKKLYKVQESSGSGGYGRTVIAKDMRTRDKRLVVLKKLKHTRESEINHNLIEIGALSSCNHPNIVTFYDAFLEKDPKKQIAEALIVMEYMQGGTLREASEGCKLTEKHMAFFARELLRGLSYLHSRNWAHRDLKSSNVMIDVHGKIKLIDLGLVADLSEGPRSGCVGTPYWIPPEMIRQEKHSFPADIWSLGVCILELLLGHPPYHPNTIKCMFKVATIGLTHLIPTKASPHARDFVSLCLTFNQTTRPSADELLQHEWVNQTGIDEGIEGALDAIFLNKQLSSLIF